MNDGPFDAISSIGMFEHVGRNRMEEYIRGLYELLPAQGRLLNHAISRPGYPQGDHLVGRAKALTRRLATAVGSDITSKVESESLREHYELTLRRWVANLEANWDEAVSLVGEGRARVWRLYMAASAVNFALGGVQIQQVLGVKSTGGRSGMPLRTGF